MATHQLEWRTNFRANLYLWPEIAPNIRAVAECTGQKYDERAILAQFPTGKHAKQPKTTRSVRNAVESLSLVGLCYRTGAPQDKLMLTKLGEVLFKFLGVGTSKPLINDKNRQLAAERSIAGLAVILEYRTIWKLMRLTGNRLTNDELNRAMRLMKTTANVEEAADRILEAREKGDLSLIGPYLYTGRNKADQRKMINPWFLRAGGGRLFIWLPTPGSGSKSKFRHIEDWAVPMLDAWTKNSGLPSLHASTDASCAQAISEHSGCG